MTWHNCARELCSWSCHVDLIMCNLIIIVMLALSCVIWSLLSWLCTSFNAKQLTSLHFFNSSFMVYDLYIIWVALMQLCTHYIACNTIYKAPSFTCVFLALLVVHGIQHSQLRLTCCRRCQRCTSGMGRNFGHTYAHIDCCAYGSR